MPSPQLQIKVIYDLYNQEPHPFRKVHRLIDIFETIIKTHTAVIISNWLDLEESNEYSYSNREEWIFKINDEDDSEQIELWAKWVEKEKMNEIEFVEKVKGLLGN